MTLTAANDNADETLDDVLEELARLAEEFCPALRETKGSLSEPSASPRAGCASRGKRDTT